MEKVPTETRSLRSDSVLKEKLAARIFYLFVFRCEGKILLTLLVDHIFAYDDRKNNSVASLRLPKKVNFGPCDCSNCTGENIKGRVFFLIIALD